MIQRTWQELQCVYIKDQCKGVFGSDERMGWWWGSRGFGGLGWWWFGGWLLGSLLGSYGVDKFGGVVIGLCSRFV